MTSRSTLTSTGAGRSHRSATTFLIPLAAVAALAIVGGSSTGQQRTPVPADTLVTYDAQVYDLLDQHCLKCHAQGESNPSELFMDTYEGLIEGGKHGSPIVAGEPEKSILLQKVLPNPPFGRQMPAKTRTMLTEDEVSLLRRWISQGALEKKPAMKSMKKD